MTTSLKLFAFNSCREYGAKVAARLNVKLSHHEERRFADGEWYVAPSPADTENIRGCDVFLLQSVYTDEVESIDEKMMKILIMLGALRDASAERITLALPYYPYARQDRQTQPRAPVTTKYVANMFSLYADRILTLDVHSPTAIQNAYKGRNYDLLEGYNLFADEIAKAVRSRGLLEAGERLVVMSPDSSGLKRAKKFRWTLMAALGISPADRGRAIKMACLDKLHDGDTIEAEGIMGDVRGATVILYDDMISSGKTTHECLKACRDNGAKTCLAACSTHGLFVGEANRWLDDPFLQTVMVSDSIRPFRLASGIRDSKLQVISTVDLMSETIRRIHHNESVSDLMAAGIRMR